MKVKQFKTNKIMTKLDRVNFDKNVKMHVACSTDKTRPQYQCIYFENGYAYATDATLLVKNRIDQISNLDPEQIILLEGKMVHKKDFASFLKFDMIIVTEDGIEAVTDERKAFFYFFECEQEFPNVEKIMSEAERAETKEVAFYGIDLSISLKASKSLPYQNSRLIFKGANKAVVVKSIGHDIFDDCMALIMPLMLEE